MANVEGMWKNFTFKFIEPEDIPKVYQHLRASFYLDERVSELSGYSEEYAKDFETMYDWVFSLGSKLNFAAIDTGTGKVAGVRITYKHTRETSFAHLKFESQQMANMMRVIGVCNEEANIFGRYPTMEYYAFYITASIGKEYRDQGLATEMYRRSEGLLREHNFPLVASCFTSPWTRRIARNMNFVELSRCYFKGLKDDNGQFIFPDATEEDFGATMALKL